MPSLRLKYEIVPNPKERQVTIKVYKMCASIRGKGTLHQFNGYRLTSESHLAIDRKVIFLPGNMEPECVYDLKKKPLTYTGRVDEDANEFAKNAHIMLHDFVSSRKWSRRKQMFKSDKRGNVISLYA